MGDVRPIKDINKYTYKSIGTPKCSIEDKEHRTILHTMNEYTFSSTGRVYLSDLAREYKSDRTYDKYFRNADVKNIVKN